MTSPRVARVFTMRSSVLRQSQQVLRTHQASSRSFATFPQRSSPIPVSACQSCSRKLSQPASQTRRQRRSQSSTAPSEAPLETSIPVPRTHYEFFPQTVPQGPPPNGPFFIDPRALRQEFLQLQAKAHPDRHQSHLKARAEATSARINEAYKTLQNPLLRAQYLLSLNGIDVAEDETAKVEDPELLMEVLNAREEIEEAQEEGELERLKNINDERISAGEKALDEASFC